MELPRLCYIRGNLAMVCPYIDDIGRAAMPQIPAHALSNGAFQVILATEDELRESPRKFDESLFVIDQDSIIDLGVGSYDGVYNFNAIFWKEGIELRRNWGLPFEQLHIALSGADNAVSVESFRLVKVLDLVGISNSYVHDHQVSLLVDYCKYLGRDSTLMTTSTGMEIVAVLSHLSAIPQSRNGDAKLFDLLAVMLYKTKDLEGCMITSKELMSLFPKDPRGYFRCAACYVHAGRSSHGLPAAPAYCWKLAMVLYGEAVKCALANDEEQNDQRQPACSFSDNLVQQACQAILHCSKYTEFGCLITCAEAEDFPKEYLHLTLPWNPGVRSAVLQAFKAVGEPHYASKLLSLDSRERLFIYDNDSKQFLKLPRFFRWITPFRVAAMSTPKSAEDIRLVAKLGIGTIVTLTKEEVLNSAWFTTCSFPRTRNMFIPVPNYKAPTIPQIDLFFSFVDHSRQSDSAVLVHCGGGKGRAGTFVACYVARYGFTGVADQQPKYSATEVVKAVRHMRPGSIETDEQELFIVSFVKELWRRAQIGGKVLLFPEPDLEDNCNQLQIEGRFNPKCRILLCCGIPGSGKSTVSGALARVGWTVASQDETGSRDGCATVVSNAMRQNKPVIVDRCNPTTRDRKEWIDLAMASPNEASCLFFDYDEALCLQRAKLRLDHPTLTSDGQCRNAIRSMSKNLQRPSLSEGFGAIVTIRSIAAADKFIQLYGVTANSTDLKGSSSSSSFSPLPLSSTQGPHPELRLAKFHKYPRTRHLFNFGSATRDDLVMSKADAASFFNSSAVEAREGDKVVITFEEKVDGANLGFSMDPETGDIRAQNRSHFVNSKSHSQFKKLDYWIDTHREDLMNLLRPQHAHSKHDNSEPGQFVLFGEWLLATHSIKYTRLPDYFLAFDVFNVAEQKFWSRERFWTAIKGTSIQAVPHIPLPEDVIDEEVFKDLMRRQSAFYDGGIEGVYVRRDRGPFLLDRGKVVRSDFINGNVHWSKQIVAAENIIKRF